MDSSQRRIRRALLSIAAAGGALAVLGLAGAAQSGSGDKPQTAGQKYKNIKVLKNVPADQLGPIMHQWNASLGVRCDFCHAIETDASGRRVGYEKDVKPEKEMARKMVLMTQKLNKDAKLLEGRGTCFMCHHGHASPELKAPPEAPPSR